MLAKISLIKDVLNSIDAFYPYIIKDYERPDIIAYDVYNDETLVWVIYFANNIVDPYYDWPLFGDQFTEYLEKKYQTSIYSLMSTTSHYKYTGISNEAQEDIDRKSYKMSPETHAYMVANSIDTSGWSPVSIYDYEDELNEAKRSIRLLNKFYIPQLEKELLYIFD